MSPSPRRWPMSRASPARNSVDRGHGGGTSDFSIVRVSPEGRTRADRSQDVLANKGVHIGGTDIDRLLSLRAVMPCLASTARGAEISEPRFFRCPMAYSWTSRRGTGSTCFISLRCARTTQSLAPLPLAGADRAIDRGDREPAWAFDRARGRGRQDSLSTQEEAGLTLARWSGALSSKRRHVFCTRRSRTGSARLAALLRKRSGVGLARERIDSVS